jgi:hypothetical protein
MAYFIFLKYLRSLEDFRKNPHVKIPPKSPPTNFQSLGIFKKSNFIRKRIFLTFGPTGPAASRPIRTFGPAAALFFPLKPAVRSPPPHWASASRPAQLTSRPNRSSASTSCTGAKRTRRRHWLASRYPHGRPRRPPVEEKNGRINPPSFPY